MVLASCEASYQINYFAAVEVVPETIRAYYKDVAVLHLVSIGLRFFRIITIGANLKRKIKAMLLLLRLVQYTWILLMGSLIFSSQNHIPRVSKIACLNYIGLVI